MNESLWMFFLVGVAVGNGLVYVALIWRMTRPWPSK